MFHLEPSPLSLKVIVGLMVPYFTLSLAVLMYCELFLLQFVEGHKYHFAVRAIDVHDRVGEFSAPGSIMLTSSNPQPA